MKIRAIAFSCATLLLSSCAHKMFSAPASEPVASSRGPASESQSSSHMIEGTWESDCAAVKGGKFSRSYLRINGNILIKIGVTYSDKNCSNVVKIRPIELQTGSQNILRISEAANGYNIDLENTYCKGQVETELDIFKLDASGSKLNFGETENPSIRPTRLSRRTYSRFEDWKLTYLLVANAGKTIGSCDGR